MSKPKLTPKEIRVLELATDVLEKIAGASDGILQEQAERALEDVRSTREEYGASKPLDDEP